MTDWARIVGKHGPAVFTTAWRILGHATETEEVVQEVFRDAHPLHQADEPRCWELLLRRLAAERALERLRRRWNALSPSDDDRELTDRLRLALADLPRRQALVFSLRHFGDLSVQEISSVCRINPRVVEADLEDARASLEAMLLRALQET